MRTKFLLINATRIYHLEEYMVTCGQNSLCLGQGPVFRWNVMAKSNIPQKQCISWLS